ATAGPPDTRADVRRHYRLQCECGRCSAGSLPRCKLNAGNLMAPAPTLPNRLVIAIGGNATHPEEIAGTAPEQKGIAPRTAAAPTAAALLPLALADNELVLVHGNGPVVGKILMRQALTRDRVPPMPMDICVAHSQGGIAYLLMQAIENALREVGSQRHCTCL